MAEANLITYSFKELAELMVKDRGLNEGVWGVYIKFGINAANAGETDASLRPTALVPVLEIGLQKFQEVNNLSIDAGSIGQSPRRRSGGIRATKKTPRKASKKK
ncbi:MAG: hypothetical protein ABR501_06760 [Pyrinomonadaceae bacterium]